MPTSEYKTAGDFVSSYYTLPADMMAEAVVQWFKEHGDVATVPVVSATGVVAVLSQRRFSTLMSGRFGHALYGDHPILEISDRDFVLVTAETPLAQLGHILALRDGERFYDDIIVNLPDGRVGTAPVRGILAALHEISSETQRDLLVAREQNRQLQRQAEERWEMLSSLSHELRTPLSAILGYLELLETYLTDSEKSRKFVHQIRSTTQELLAHIQEVLDMARTAVGKITLVPETFDLRDEIRAAAELLQVLTRERAIRISVRNLPEALIVKMDRKRLRQVLVNLCGNAAKFTLAGSIGLSVTVNHENLQIAVSDTGPGIPPDQLPKLFQRFERVGNPNVEGSGLGLMIAKALIEAQGGQIEVASVLNQGTTFTVIYPRPEIGVYENPVL